MDVAVDLLRTLVTDTALGLWHSTRDNLCCTLPATKVRSHCPSTYEAHVSLSTKKIFPSRLHWLLRPDNHQTTIKGFAS